MKYLEKSSSDIVLSVPEKKNGPFISSFSMPIFYHVIGVNISCYIVLSSGRLGVGEPFRIDRVHSSKLLGSCGQS